MKAKEELEIFWCEKEVVQKWHEHRRQLAGQDTDYI